MRTIRVETTSATILLTEAPAPKVRDRQTGEVAKDATSGETLMKVGVVYIDEGESSLIHVTVPESGVTDGLALGSPVSLPGLVARPWDSVFNGQQRHGIAYRAAAVAPGAVPAGVGGLTVSELMTLVEVGGPVAGLGAGAAYLRARHPAAYWSAVGMPASAVRLVGSYGSVMDSCGLTVPPSRLRALAVRAATRREVRPVPPRRGLLRPTSTGLRIRLRLAPGQEPADIAVSAERLRHAWGVHGVYVEPVKPGAVELRLVGFDVLQRVRMPRKAGGGFLRVPVALREDATAFVRDYRAIPHELVLGATLSGKSMYLRHLVAGLAEQRVALAGIDCKRGVELAPFAPRLSALATDPAEAAELLPVLVQEMEDRYDLIRTRQGIAPSTPDEEITSDVWGLPEAERPVPIVLFVERWRNCSWSLRGRMRSGGMRWSPG